jgi:hypothetical protein
MLQVGDIGLSVTEQRSHFALWSLMASPLLIGSDVSMRESRSDFWVFKLSVVSQHKLLK